ncbi:S-adenosylmethionine synthetase [unidentified eubacterium SCB49]|nr:S-adenosylmethionine synthetase [unidentified eubacterium SCB49]
MRKSFVLLFTLLGLNSIQAQNFDIKDFNEKAETAEWLLNYDLVAWYSTDTLMTKDKERISKLGREWFCFQDSTNTWHSVYGKYENGKYDQVFHFIVKSQSEVTETNEQIDTTFLNKHGQALSRAYAEMKPINDSTSIRFNHYIKENDSGNLDVYIFPAFQPNGTAVYGGEFVYEISPENKIMNDNSYYQGQFLGFKTGEPREIWLNYREKEKPTLGSVFFAWYYKDYFTKINIDNKTSFSTPFNDGGNYTWLNVIKDPKAEAKKKKQKEREERKKNKKRN